MKFPDKAVALRLPVEVAVALYFAEGVAVENRRRRVTRSQGPVRRGGSRTNVRQYLFEVQGSRRMSRSIKSEFIRGLD